MLGGLVLGLSESLAAGYVSGAYEDVFAFGVLVLILFVLFEPMGLYGRWLKVRTWFTLAPFYRKGLFRRQKSFQKSDRVK